MSSSQHQPSAVRSIGIKVSSVLRTAFGLALLCSATATEQVPGADYYYYCNYYYGSNDAYYTVFTYGGFWRWKQHANFSKRSWNTTELLYTSHDVNITERYYYYTTYSEGLRYDQSSSDHYDYSNAPDRVFHIADCHTSTYSEIYMAKFALDFGFLDHLLNDSNFTINITKRSTCGFIDAGRTWLSIMQGVGTGIGSVQTNRSVHPIPRVVAVAGCRCSDASQTLTLISTAVGGTPIISGQAAAPGLGIKTQFPTFMRTIPNDLVPARVQARLVRFFNWTRLHWMVYDGEDFGSFYRITVREYLAVDRDTEDGRWYDHTHTVLTKPAVQGGPSDWAALDFQAMREEIVQAFPRTRVWPRIIFFMTETPVVQILTLYELWKYGLVRNDSVLILPSMQCAAINDFTTFFSDREREGWAVAANKRNDTLDYFAHPYWDDPAIYLRGSLCLAPFADPRNSPYKDLIYELLRTARRSPQDEAWANAAVGAPHPHQWPDPEKWMLSTLRPIVFDAILTIIHSISKLLHEGRASAEIHGDVLREAMLSAKFLGTSGNVSFDVNGERRGDYLVNNLRSNASDPNGSMVLVQIFRYTDNATFFEERQEHEHDGSGGDDRDDHPPGGGPEDDDDDQEYTEENMWKAAEFKELPGFPPIFADGSSNLADYRPCGPGQEAVVKMSEPSEDDDDDDDDDASNSTQAKGPPPFPPWASGSRVEECRSCNVGQFRTGADSYNSVHCMNCSKGHFADRLGMSVCHPCQPGRVATAEGASACSECPAGKYQEERDGETSCQPCSRGHYSDASGFAQCRRCQRGKFSDVSGLTSCKSCEDNKTTEELASSDSSDCICAEGTYQTGLGGDAECASAPEGMTCPFNSSFSDCECKSGFRASGYADFRCISCEDHLKCPGGHNWTVMGLDGKPDYTALDQTILVEEGYMTEAHAPHIVYSCVSTRVCPGERSPYQTAPGADRRICVDNVEVLPRCGSCRQGWYGIASIGCSSCKTGDYTLFYMKFTLTFIANQLVVLYLYKRFNRPQPAGLITLACVVSMIQTLQTISQLPLEWPNVLKFAFDILDLLFTIEGIMETLEFRMECLFGNNFRVQVLRKALSPMLIFVDFALLYIFIEVYRRLRARTKKNPVEYMERTESWRLQWPLVHNVIGLVFTRLFISIIRLSLTLFYRLKMPSGRVMVHSIPELEFASPEWFEVLPQNICASIAYGGTTVTYVVYLVMVAAKKASEANGAEFIVKARFCFGSFRPDRRWWILFQLFYAFAINFTQVTTPASNVHGKLYITLLFLIVFTTVEFNAEPFKFAQNNAVDLTLNTALITLLVCATSFIDAEQLSASEIDRWNEYYSYLILGVFSLCLLWATYHFLQWFWSVFQEKGNFEGQRALQGWQFRDCAAAMLLLDDQKLMARLSVLGDYDLKQLQAAKDTMITVLFGQQVTTLGIKQRLLPGEPYKVWDYKQMQIDNWDQIESGDFEKKVLQSHKVRGWLLQMALLLQREPCGKTCSGSRSPTKVSSRRLERTNSMASWASMVHRRVSSEVNSVMHRTLREKLEVHVERLVHALDLEEDVPVSLEEFKAKVGLAFPDLAISSEDIELIFHVADIENKQEIRKDNFVLTVNALLPANLISKDPDSPRMGVVSSHLGQSTTPTDKQRRRPQPLSGEADGTHHAPAEVAVESTALKHLGEAYCEGETSPKVFATLQECLPEGVILDNEQAVHVSV